MDVAVIGAGRVGTAIAILLRDAGHRITALAGRDATRERAARFLPGVPVIERDAAAKTGELVLLGVPDDAIADVALGLSQNHALHEGQWVAHVSGASGLDAVASVRAVKARPLAIHPLQTFPDIEGALERIPGCAMAVTADDEEGYELGERLAKDLRANAFRLADEDRPLYHAAAVFASNYVVATAGIAEELFARAGIPDPVDAMLPLVRATVDNIGRLGPAGALTGPAVRGDAGTVAKNLHALSQVAPEAVPAYVALARIALDLATSSGRLSVEGRERVEGVLARWT